MKLQIPITALETGRPVGIHSAQLEPGESRLDFVIRHYPDEWVDFAARMKEVLNLSEGDSNRLRDRDPAVIRRPQVLEQVTQWSNRRLPVHWRTFKCLAEMRSSERPLREPWPQLAQVLVVKEEDPSGDRTIEDMYTQLGAEVVSRRTGTQRDLDYRQVLDKVRGQYLWVVPGQSVFKSNTVQLALHHILSQFEKSARTAVYFDRAYSYVVRVSALQSAADYISGPLTGDSLARALRQMGMIGFAGPDPEHPLCEIERIYGGTYPFPKPVRFRKSGGKGLLARWFGRLGRGAE